jgi:hypothetical protein
VVNKCRGVAEQMSLREVEEADKSRMQTSGGCRQVEDADKWRMRTSRDSVEDAEKIRIQKNRG